MKLFVDCDADTRLSNTRGYTHIQLLELIDDVVEFAVVVGVASLIYVWIRRI